MAFTYSDSPATVKRDEFRLLIQDTTAATALFTDAEVTYWLTKASSVTLCAALACRSVAAKYASTFDYSLGELSESASQRVKHWTDLAASLEQSIGRITFTSTTPTIGTVTDSGTQPHTYDVSDEKPADWSLNTEDLPDTVRGVDT